MRIPQLAAIVLTSIAVTACNGLGVPPRPMASFDLGLVAPRSLPAQVVPAQIQLLAPSWLETSAMQYRLSWDQTHRRRSFANSRWAAHPPEMLARNLERAIGGTNIGTSECRLRLELDEFVQVFDTEQRSEARVVLRASWLPARSDKSLARKEFALSSVASEATAEGGVTAFLQISEMLADQLAQWLTGLDDEGQRDLNVGAACRS